MNANRIGITNVLLAGVVLLLVANLAVPLARDLAPEPPPDDALVVRIPRDLAEKWGLSEEGVRTVIEGFATIAKYQANQPRSRRPASGGDPSAIATLRNLSSAQAQFQASGVADADRDGGGEYGSFGELSGARDIRDDQQVGSLNPPVLSGAFRKLTSAGLVPRSGYHFVIYLPDVEGRGVVADVQGFGRVDSNQAETTWCGYAWPIETGKTGQRVYVVNQCGDVLSTESRNYTGTRAPLPGAAFLDGGPDSIAGRLAVGARGQDGNVWRAVN